MQQPGRSGKTLSSKERRSIELHRIASHCIVPDIISSDFVGLRFYQRHRWIKISPSTTTATAAAAAVLQGTVVPIALFPTFVLFSREKIDHILDMYSPHLTSMSPLTHLRSSLSLTLTTRTIIGFHWEDGRIRQARARTGQHFAVGSETVFFLGQSLSRPFHSSHGFSKKHLVSSCLIISHIIFIISSTQLHPRPSPLNQLTTQHNTKQTNSDKDFGYQKSSIKQGDLNPVWNEDFVFSNVPDLDNMVLTLKVMDSDIGSKDDKCGKCKIKLEHEGITSQPKRFVKTIDRNLIRANGTITVDISYHP